MQTKSSVNRLSAGMRSLIGSLALFLFGATTVYAGLSPSVTPSTPSPMNVGAPAVTGTLTVTNFSTGPNQPHTVSVTGIFMTASCGPVLGGCSASDIGVFSVTNARPDPGSACASNSFTIVPGVNPGEIEFKPLNDVELPASPSQCTILFDIAALRQPVVDADTASPGIQTRQLARIEQMQDKTTFDRTSASGSGKVTVTIPNLIIEKSPD